MPYSIGEASDEVAELARLAVVEPGGGLVEQQDRRRRRDRACDPDEPASTVGQLAREAVEIVLEPELAGAAHGGRREDRSRRPDQVAQAGEPRAHSGARRAGSRRPRSPRRARATGTNAGRPRVHAGPDSRTVPTIGVPLRSIRPALGFVKPVRASTMVVFPAPFGPISPTTSRGVDAEAHAVDRDDGAEPDGQVLDLERRGRHRAGCDVDELLAGRCAAKPQAQLADAPLVVEHHARDPVRVQDHDEDERDAADRDEPRAEIDPVERDRAQPAGREVPAEDGAEHPAHTTGDRVADRVDRLERVVAAVDDGGVLEREQDPGERRDRRPDREGVELGAEDADPERRRGALVVPYRDEPSSRTGAPQVRHHERGDHEDAEAHDEIAIRVVGRADVPPEHLDPADRRHRSEVAGEVLVAEHHLLDGEPQPEGDDREVHAAGAERGDGEDGADEDREHHTREERELGRPVLLSPTSRDATSAPSPPIAYCASES